MDLNPVDSIQLNVVAPVNPLTGLDVAEAKLRAIEARVKAINETLSKPLNVATAFTSADAAGRARKNLAGGTMNAEAMAKAFGWDPKQFIQYVAQVEKQIIAGIQRSKTAISSATGDFTSGRAADRAIQGFSKRNAEQVMLSLKDLLAPVPVTLQTGGGGGGGGGSGTGGTSGVGTGRPFKADPDRRPGKKSGAVLETTITTPADPTKAVSVKTRMNDGGTTRDYHEKKAPDGAVEAGKTVEKVSAVGAEVRKWNSHLDALKRQYTQAVTDAKGAPALVVEARRKYAEQLDAMVQQGGALTALGKGRLVDRAAQEAINQRSKAAKAEAGLERDKAVQHAREIASEQATFRKRVADHAKQVDAAEQEARLAIQLQAEGQIARRQALAKAGAAAESAREKAATALGKHDVDEGDRRQQRMRAHARLQAALAGGATVKEERFTMSGDKPTGKIVKTRQELGGGRVREEIFNWNRNGASVTSIERTGKAIDAAAESAKRFDRDIIRNTANVTAWAASVAILYQGLGLIAFGFQSLVGLDAQVARLGQVFSKVGGNTQQLALDTLSLAAANGRAADEAMESAISWSRMGLRRVQVLEAVRVSLMAANVAEISAGDATQKLSAIMRSYNLEVGQLATLLGMLNHASNTYQVTNADMLEGIARTGAVAKQAGLPLSHLIGMLGATIAATGQSGANLGNAIKSVIAALGSPELQKGLREQFRLEVTTHGGSELKGMDEILRGLYVRFQELNSAQQQSLLFQVGGKTQISRLSALLDNYIREMALAINVQLNLNSAEAENAKIRETLQARLRALATEFQRFAYQQGNRGPAQAMSQVVQAFRNLLALANTSVGSGVMTSMLVLATALTAKLALTAVAMQQTGGKAGFVASSLNAIAGSARNLSVALTGVVRELNAVASNPLDKRFAGWMRGMDLRGRQMSRLGARSFRDAFGPATVAGMFDYTAMDRFGRQVSGRQRAGSREEMMKRLVQAEVVPLSVAAVAGPGMLARNGLVALGSLQVALGTTMRLIGAAAAAFRMFFSFLPIMGVLAAVTWGFNRAMEGVGRSSDSALARMAGFNAAAESAAKGADAARTAADLFDTVADTLDRKGPGEKVQAIKDVVSVQLLSKGVVDELNAASQRGDFEAVKGSLRRQAAIERTNAVLRRQDEFESKRKERDEAQADVSRLESARAGTFGFLASKQSLDEANTRLAQLNAVVAGKVIAKSEGDDLEGKRDSDQQYQVRLERRKAGLESLAELVRSLPTFSHEDKLNAELAVIRAQESALENRLKLLGASDRSESGVLAGMRQEYVVQERQLAAMRAAYSEFERMNPRPDQPQRGARVYDPYASRRREFLREIGAQEELVNARSVPQATGDQERNMLERRDDEKALRELRARQAGMESVRDQARRLDEMHALSERARGEISVFGSGDSRAEQLLDRNRKLAEYMARQEAQMPRAKGADLENLQLRFLVAATEQSKTLLEIDRERYDLERRKTEVLRENNREFQRSLLTSGPGDLLRKMAALQMSTRKLSLGQFMAADPKLREDLQRLGHFNPDLMEVNRAQRRLGPGESDAGLRGRAGVMSQTSRGYYPGISSAFPQNFTRELMDKSAFMAAELGRLGAKFGHLTQSAEFLTGKFTALASAAAMFADAMARLNGPGPYVGGQFGGQGGANGY